MQAEVLSTSTVSGDITLQDKTIYRIDYGKLCIDELEKKDEIYQKCIGDELEKKDEIYQRIENKRIIECYRNIAHTNQYLIDLLSTKPNLEEDIFMAVDSSILISDIDGLIKEAVDSAEIYQSVQLSRREEVELNVVGALKNKDYITAIYTQRYRSELQFIVLLSCETYDNNLMYELLDIEYQLQKQFREPFLAFSYIPKIYKNKREIVHRNAKLIYEK